MLPIYISFFLSTVARETVQRANAVIPASKSGIPTIRVRNRGIVRIFSVKNPTASQKEDPAPLFSLCSRGTQHDILLFRWSRQSRKRR